jgi:serine/threonine protein kinase/tetratricopeptide (TPR) repeat protein
LTALLGTGGMGAVYRARDTRLGRQVAVKVLPDNFAGDPDRRARFEREARAVAALSHPNILAIHDYGTAGPVTYAVMELLEGETLRTRLSRGPLPWREAAVVGAAVAEGLAAAHAKGIVHRDLKPENLFLTTACGVKILDFGLARVTGTGTGSGETETATHDVPGHTEPGAVLGTVGYMSPEQVRGQPADARSDLFSLGCVLHEAVTGRRPFARPTAADTQSAILRDGPPALSACGVTGPPALEELIRHCLEKDVALRWQEARELARALHAVATGPDAGTGTSPRRTVGGRRRAPRALDSLAVLPLINVSHDAELEYVSDGITESIIHMLSRVPRLRLMARSTVFRYKGRDVDAQAAGRELNVRAVFTGRMLARGNRLTVKAEVVDVDDGSQLWSEQYGHEFSEILALEEAIAREIVESLRLRLSGEQRQRLRKRPTQDTEVYRLYLKGRYYWNKRSEEGLREAIAHFTQVLDRDPSCAQAYAGLADCYALLPNHASGPPKEFLPQAEAAANRALQLDETLAEAHASLGMVRYSFNWDWAGAEREFRRAIELNPNYGTAHHWYAYLLMLLGRFDEALAALARARELDPLSLIINATSGFILFCARRYDDAIAHCERALATSANFSPSHYFLGLACEQKGLHERAIAAFQTSLRLAGGASHIDAAALAHATALAGRADEARRIGDELARRGQTRYVPPFCLALIALGLGDTRGALEILDRACQERDFYLIYLKVDPRLDPLRGDPHFADLLGRVGLAP